MLKRVNQAPMSGLQCQGANNHYERLGGETANQRVGQSLLRSCDVDIEGLHRVPHPAYHFASPERRAKERYPPVFWVAYSTEDIALIGWLVSVHAAPRKFAFERGIRSLRSRSRAYSEGFSLEALEELEQLNLPWLRQHQAAPTSFSKLKPAHLAKLPNTVDVAKKIDNIEIISSQGREER